MPTSPPPAPPNTPEPPIPTPPPAYHIFKGLHTTARLSAVGRLTPHYLTLFEQETDVPIHLTFDQAQTLLESMMKLQNYLKHYGKVIENTIFVDHIVVTDTIKISLKYGRYETLYNNTKPFQMAFIQQDHWDPVGKRWLMAKQHRSDTCAINFVRFNDHEYLALYVFLKQQMYKQRRQQLIK